MFEIKGKKNTAICFASVVADGAIEQIRRMCDYELTEGSKIRIMPDVHAGKGCTIGTTMTVTDKAVPNIVGVDIGCGMYTVKLGNVEINLEKIDEAAHFVPSGTGVWDNITEDFDLTELKCYHNLKKVNYLKKSLGTLGGGNHFIEVEVNNDGEKYLIIHSGSRNLGKQVAEYYQNLAIDLNLQKEEYYKDRENLIKTYKEQGRNKEIQSELKKLESEFKAKKTTIPEDLCYLYGSYLDDYLHDVEICQQFAKRNREKIADAILTISGLEPLSSFHTIHNYIDVKEMILRKGAISAYKEELVLIPINMRDGSILAKGRGNEDWNYSAPHGAGRVLSRSQAFNQLSMEDYKRQMEGIYSTSVNENTLDEAPMAYKSLDAIENDIRSAVDVVDILKPIYNFKAG